MLTHVLAVVGGVDYNGIIRDLTIAQGREDFADFVIKPLRQGVVKFPALSYDIFRNVLDVKADAKMFIVPRLGFEMTPGNFRHRDLTFVMLPVLLRHNQWKMRGKVTNQHEERLVEGPAIIKKFDCRGRYLSVVL